MDINLLINKANNESSIETPDNPIKHQFDDFKIDSRLKNNITSKGYLSPTPIQDETIPVGLEGRDVIGIANTGTGKTAAFLIPLINKMLINGSHQALIVTPTRELAFQINEEFKEFAKGFGLTSALCIGGTNLRVQQRMFNRPINFVIGTPGRIIDLLNRKVFSLSRFHNVVLDEADRMVDMGFIKDIRLILGKLPTERQSFFFTATLEAKVEELIRQFMNNPIKVSVKIRQTPTNIEQDIVHVPSGKTAKQNILIELLKKPEFEKVLVFCRTKHGANKVVKALHERRIRSNAIHGNKSQNYRLKALDDFKKNAIQVLVATDVAARGLDISSVSHVINFDIPATYDDYVHRIGRTGRADKLGKALTFVPQE
ncbi:MAG: DEAD/DEAH box helicase [Patescibacteria group bacterium]|nr:DEAD/DEAH box helicase [Patescibacteria group bacterium]